MRSNTLIEILTFIYECSDVLNAFIDYTKPFGHHFLKLINNFGLFLANDLFDFLKVKFNVGFGCA
jgi:hypothetical protein